MGIGNDIKPKKVYRYKPEHHYDPFSLHNHHEDKKKEEPEESHSKSSHNEADGHNDAEKVEDDFFHDYNKTTKKKVKKERSSGGFLFQNLNAKNITWLLIIALIVIVIYQNFDSIKGIFIKNNTTSKNSNSDEYYEGVNANQNSNSGDVNSNLNANVNANLNTNTAAASPTVDKSSITLKVLNGNGIAGSADKVAAILKTAGFLPAKSANASKFTYLQTLIYYKTGQEEAANLVKAALPALTTTLQNSDSIVGTYDVIVVTGKK